MTDENLLKGQKGGKGGGGDPPKEAPNTLRAKSIARILDVISEGPIVGLVDGDKSVFFDETPIKDAAGNINHKGVAYYDRNGYPDQDHVPGFDSVEAEESVGVEVKYGIPITRTVTGVDFNAVRIKVLIPALSELNTENGDLNGSRVKFKITVSSQTTGDSQAFTDTISGKCVSNYVRNYRMELPGTSPWNIVMERITPDSATSNVQNKTFFSSYSTIIDGKLRYPDTAVIGVEADAELFGGAVPQRAYMVKGLIINVPTNYNPETRVYATSGAGTSGGLWDGTFKMAWSDNPVWVLLDLIINERYGLGIGLEHIDLGAFYTIAQYCDEFIDDGLGGTAPRHTFNYSISTREDAYKVLQGVASSFRGMCYWSSGAITLAADMPADPVKLVTPANVIDGRFNYSGSGLQSRHSVALVTWNDPADNFKPTVEVVEDPESLERYGYNSTDVTLVGCTNRAEAHRYGKWLLDTEKTATETVSYRAALDHADLRPGDIVEIADPAFAGVRYGGRIVARTATTLTLDAQPDLAVGPSYTIKVTQADGVILSVAMSSPVENADGTMTVTVPTMDPLPPVGSLWIITGDVTPRQFRVISAGERENNIFEISALFHDPNKYARVEQGLSLSDPTYTRPDRTATVPVPVSPFVVPTNYYVNNQTRTRLTLSWTSPADPFVVAYDVRYAPPGDLFTPEVRVEAQTFEIPDASIGEYVFELRSRSSDGRVSPWVTELYECTGKDALIENATGLTTTPLYRAVKVSWSLPVIPDFDSVKVYASTTDDFLTATVLQQTKANNFIHTPIEPGTRYYYWVVALDTSGNEVDLDGEDGYPVGVPGTASAFPPVDIGGVLREQTRLALTQMRDILAAVAAATQRDVLTHLDGEPVVPLVRGQRDTLGLIGSRSADGSTFVLNTETVQNEQGETLAAREAAIEAKAQTALDRLDTITQDEDGDIVVDGAALREQSVSPTALAVPALSDVSTDLGTMQTGKLENADASFSLDVSSGSEAVSVETGSITYRGTGIGVESEAIYLWIGPSSVARADATKANAWMGLSSSLTGGPRLFGSDAPSLGPSSVSKLISGAASLTADTGTWTNAFSVVCENVPEDAVLELSATLSGGGFTPTGTGATHTAETRWVETDGSGTTVIGTSQALSVTDSAGTNTWNQATATLVAAGSKSGSVTYALQTRRTSGTSVTVSAVVNGLVRATISG